MPVPDRVTNQPRKSTLVIIYYAKLLRYIDSMLRMVLEDIANCVWKKTLAVKMKDARVFSDKSTFIQSFLKTMTHCLNGDSGLYLLYISEAMSLQLDTNHNVAASDSKAQFLGVY